MTWKATSDAEHDLDAITTLGARDFGIREALEYYDGLIAVFGTLAANPQIAPERPAKGRSIRLFPFKAHNILYAIDGDDIVILRILHGSANWIGHL